MINNYDVTLQDNLKEIEKDLYTTEKQSIELRVKNTSSMIVYKQSIIKNELKERVKNRVNIAYAIATKVYEKNKSIKSQIDIKKDIYTALEALVWNNGESFIWIIDFDGIFYLAPE